MLKCGKEQACGIENEIEIYVNQFNAAMQIVDQKIIICEKKIVSFFSWMNLLFRFVIWIRCKLEYSENTWFQGVNF